MSRGERHVTPLRAHRRRARRVTWLICVTWRIHMCCSQHIAAERGCLAFNRLHIWVMSHVSRQNASSHMNESSQICERVMSHVWISHGTHMNASCRTYEWVMSHIWMSHVTHINSSCRTYEWVVSRIWMSHVSHEWVMSHIWRSRVSIYIYTPMYTHVCI